jgi:hypothetical protein
MSIYKILSLAIIALSFVACSAPKYALGATPFKSMDMARSDLDAIDAPARSINPGEAKNHICRRMTVCGVVASADYDADASGRPTVLSFDEPYPSRIFTALSRGDDREKFGTPETLKGKRVCLPTSI